MKLSNEKSCLRHIVGVQWPKVINYQYPGQDQKSSPLKKKKRGYGNCKVIPYTEFAQEKVKRMSKNTEKTEVHVTRLEKKDIKQMA